MTSNLNRFLGASLLIGFSVACVSPISAQADTIAYAGDYNGDFGTVDLNTGAFSKIATIGYNSGLAVLNGNLYSVNKGVGSIYKINPANSSTTALALSLGNPGAGSLGFGSTTNGLFSIGNGQNSVDYLYAVDPSTGDTTVIGSTGISGRGAGVVYIE